LINWKKRKSIRKVLIKWKPSESSLFKKSKEGKTFFKWILMSIIGLLIFDYCLIVCCLRRAATCNWYWLMILSRWNWMRMRPAIVSTLQIIEVWNVPMIYKATFLYPLILWVVGIVVLLWNTIIEIHIRQWVEYMSYRGVICMWEIILYLK